MEKYDMCAEGTNAKLYLIGNKIKIARKGGLTNFILQGSKSEKDISISQITSIQFKKAGIASAGYIQFTFAGSGNVGKGLTEATKDENAVLFKGGKFEKQFETIRDEIQRRMDNQGVQQVVNAVSIPEQIKQLAELKEQGILTEEEFSTQKAKLLNM